VRHGWKVIVIVQLNAIFHIQETEPCYYILLQLISIWNSMFIKKYLHAVCSTKETPKGHRFNMEEAQSA